MEEFFLNCVTCWKTNTSAHSVRCEGSRGKKKNGVRLNPRVYHTLSESGGCVCCDCPSRPSQNGRKTRHGSLGRGTLIIRDCPGSMMGNKLSVISHQRTQRRKTSNALALHQSPSAPHILAAEASVTWQTVHREADIDKWLGKCSLAKMQRTSLSGTWRHCSR